MTRLGEVKPFVCLFVRLMPPAGGFRPLLGRHVRILLAMLFSRGFLRPGPCAPFIPLALPLTGPPSALLLALLLAARTRPWPPTGRRLPGGLVVLANPRVLSHLVDVQTLRCVHKDVLDELEGIIAHWFVLRDDRRDGRAADGPHHPSRFLPIIGHPPVQHEEAAHPATPQVARKRVVVAGREELRRGVAE